MTQEQNNKLYNALNALATSKEMQDLANLVIELRESKDCVKGDYNNIYPHVERSIDDLILRGAWIYEQLNGKPKRGLSLAQKLRKVLGYTYP